MGDEENQALFLSNLPLQMSSENDDSLEPYPDNPACDNMRGLDLA